MREDSDQFGTYCVDQFGVCFRRIAPGEFLMGSPESESGRYESREVQHKVTLTRALWLADTPVTQRQWKSIMPDTPSEFVGEDNPVENVTWHDAQRYIALLNEAAGNSCYRLLTDAEWEYACRAGTTTRYYWGNAFDDAGGWCTENSDGASHSVKQKQANNWGLYDMAGNVFEWCQDSYDDSSAEDKIDPLVEKEARFDTHDGKIIRGGCWYSKAVDCRSARRGFYVASFTHSGLGFRLARND